LVSVFTDALSHKKSVNLSGRAKEAEEENSYKLEQIKFDSVVSVAFLALFAITCALYYHYVTKIGMEAVGNASWNIVMNAFRRATSHDDFYVETRIPQIVQYLYSFCVTVGYVVIYVVINNFIVTRKIEWKKVILFGAICIASLLDGSRVDLIRFFIAIITVYFFLWKKNSGWNKHLGKNFYSKVLIAGLSLLIMFVLLRSVVGRLNNDNPLYDLTRYGGGSIQLLNLYLEYPLRRARPWGRETFIGFYSFFGNRFDIRAWVYSIHKEYRSSNYYVLGNVYTCFRSYIRDFGYGGMVLLVSLFSFFITTMYNFVKRALNRRPVNRTILLTKRFSIKIQPRNRRISYALLIYSYMAQSLFLSFFAENFFVVVFSFTMLKTIIFMVLASAFLANYKLHFSFGMKMAKEPVRNVG
jgi:oligosaccharide repeat unit polymerase